MKKMKKQLGAAVALLTVAALALGTATYAWFVDNTQVEIENLEFQATAAGLLEIGPGFSPTAYYSSLDATRLGANLVKPTEWTPVSADEANLTLALPTAEGTEVFWKKGETGEIGGDTVVTTYVNGNNATNYMTAQVTFRSSQAMNVFLDGYTFNLAANAKKTSVPFINYTGDTNDGNAEDLAKALRIAFVVDGDTDTATVYRFVDKATNIDEAKYNTSSAGVVATDESPISAFTTDTVTYGTEVTDILSAVTATSADDGATFTGTATPILSLDANTPVNVTIYAWLEGVDKDCVSALSEYAAGLYLPFVGINQ